MNGIVMFWFFCCWWWKLNSLSSWSLLGRFFWRFLRGKFAIKLCFTNLWISCAINSLRSFPFQQVRHIYVLVVQRIHTISKFTTSNLLLIFIVTHITTVPYPFLNCPLFNETNSKIRTFHNNFDTENEKNNNIKLLRKQSTLRVEE